MPESNTPTNKLPSSMLIEYSWQTDFSIDERVTTERLRMVLNEFGIINGEISIAIVDDSTIHNLNRQFLAHDCATDVLTFPDDRTDGDFLYGEIVVSSDTAQRISSEIGISAEGELLLYLIHGVLHLVGVDDLTDADARLMRKYEKQFLEQAGFEYRFEMESDAR